MGRSRGRRRIAAMGTSRHEPAVCPHCRAALEAVTGVALNTTEPPRIEPEDHSMCAYCFHVLRWDGLRFHPVPAATTRAFFKRFPFMREFRDEQLRKRGAEIAGAKGKVN